MFSVWLVSCYAHVFILLSVVIVTVPLVPSCKTAADVIAERTHQTTATLLGTPLYKLASINKKDGLDPAVNSRVLSDSDFSNMNVIRELLYIKHNFADMTLYSKDEIYFILEYCCTN